MHVLFLNTRNKSLHWGHERQTSLSLFLSLSLSLSAWRQYNKITKNRIERGGCFLSMTSNKCENKENTFIKSQEKVSTSGPDSWRARLGDKVIRRSVVSAPVLLGIDPVWKSYKKILFQLQHIDTASKFITRYSLNIQFYHTSLLNSTTPLNYFLKIN